MDVERMIESLDMLTYGDLCKLRVKLDELIGRIEGWQQAEPERQAGPKKVYRQEFVKCGNPVCKRCSSGGGHGPYWYSYWSEGGKTRKQYHGKHKPAEV